MDIKVNGKEYELNITVRELSNNGQTSTSMEREDQKAVLEQIREMFIDAGLTALWLSQHNKNYNKEQYERVCDLHCFLNHVEDGKFGDYTYRNENW